MQINHPNKALSRVRALCFFLCTLSPVLQKPTYAQENLSRRNVELDLAPRDCSSHKLDMEKINQAVKWIETNKTYIDSFLVQYCGQQVVEKYYNGFSAETRHELQSATKTFSATLIGIAIKEGIIKSLDQPIKTLLPKHSAHFDEVRSKITVRHLLTMTTGLKWVDFGPNNSFERIANAPDSVAFILGQPLVTSPGKTFFYNTGSSHLLAAIIHYNTGMSVLEYAKKKLFEPLEISDYVWPSLKDGIHQGGWGLYMRPIDFIKLSELYRNNGKWNSVQVIQDSFATDAMHSHVKTSYPQLSYGFQMWIPLDFGYAKIAAARGYGGQDAFVMPEQGMSVAFTGSIDQPEQMARDVKHIMRTFLSKSVVTTR